VQLVLATIYSSYKEHADVDDNRRLCLHRAATADAFELLLPAGAPPSPPTSAKSATAPDAAAAAAATATGSVPTVPLQLCAECHRFLARYHGLSIARGRVSDLVFDLAVRRAQRGSTSTGSSSSIAGGVRLSRPDFRLLWMELQLAARLPGDDDALLSVAEDRALRNQHTDESRWRVMVQSRRFTHFFLGLVVLNALVALPLEQLVLRQLERREDATDPALSPPQKQAVGLQAYVVWCAFEVTFK
jgi:hypothetical protein